jgi:filamentous hemagglutinin family protein
VATSEHVRGNAQSSSTGTARGHWLSFVLQQLPLALALVWGSSVHAAPVGGEVGAGEARIGGTSQAMVIQQGSDFVSINWKSFGIAAGESVQFVQPSRSSVALNRVLGSDASQIMGQLSANGQVFLINPNGILFGQGASVAVGGLVASTLGLSDADAQAGRYGFAEGGKGSVVNKGDITTDPGGYVALMGHSVSNTGRVVAPLGTVALVAGDAVRLDISGDQLIQVAVERGVADAWISNGGWLQADGGLVIMSTQVAGDALSNAVNNTGVVQAQAVGERQGNIVLLAGMDMGTLEVSGTLDVSGGASARGGRVVATAHDVALTGLHINASGGAGGGEVLIGGGYQGNNPEVPNADTLVMDASSRIQADALQEGNGGLVVLWSNSTTEAHGDISARGGASGGDGGLVETSSRRLDVSGVQVDTRAHLGRTGDWLLDPADVTISSAITADTTESGGTFAPDSGVGAANINVDDLIVALGLSNVIITTANSGVSGSGAGDIDVNAPITWSAPTSLTLNADRDVNVNFAITGEDGSFLANAGRDVNVFAATTTTTGRLAFTAEQDVNLNAAATVTTGELSAVAGRHVNIGVSAAATVTTGDIVLRADNDGTGPGAGEGTVTIDCGPSCLTITTGELNIRFNPVSYASTDSEILIYADKLTGGGTLNAKAWVFGLGDDKIYDGNTTATVSGLRPDSTGAEPDAVWNGASNALFDDPNIGTDRTITYESTFSDPSYELFAREDMPVGTYQARADILPITPDPDPDTTDTDPADSGPGVVEPAEALPKVRAADALPQSLAIAPQAATPQGPLSSPMLPPEPIPVVAPVVAPLVLPAPPPPRLSPRPVFVPRTLPLLPRVPKQDRN